MDISVTLKLKDKMSFDCMVSQMQKISSKILSVVDGTHLRIYDATTEFPSLRFDYRIVEDDLISYSFRDDEDSLHTFFGHEMAVKVHPSLADRFPDLKTTRLFIPTLPQHELYQVFETELN